VCTITQNCIEGQLPLPSSILHPSLLNVTDVITITKECYRFITSNISKPSNESEQPTCTSSKTLTLQLKTSQSTSVLSDVAKSPHNWIVINKLMFIQCLERKKMEPFPILKSRRLSTQLNDEVIYRILS
jgi:hypothetical protein